MSTFSQEQPFANLTEAGLYHSTKAAALVGQ